ncbi:M28 family peptidase [Psychroflexus halocasei]|uniref:Peptidase family M28 n=1 Tax=Psychroflexus halocasei TaxID=908615 RepID=A0A1H3ZXI1_9FLAO|nr:M28 family peptidase [Psychroflexus halocasei]SEA28014.1 Peptidase family M28 [Psychroflexus halocasei]
MEASKKNLYNTVDFLTSIYPYRNYKNTESLAKAADYIESEFYKTGSNVHRQKWKVNNEIYENVIAKHQPEKQERFIIGAHYDVYKEQPGADDNASSVAGLLEISRMLAQSKLPLDYGIDFVSFCLEEPPFFKKKEMGSFIHAQSLNISENNYLGMIALEMIGYYRDEKSSTNIEKEKNSLIVSGIKKHINFNKNISSLLKHQGKIGSRHLTYADNYKNNGPSDHRNYWQFDIPAVMVIGTGGHGNPNYHKPSDTIETLDFDIMKDAVESIAFTLINFDSELINQL